MIENIQLTSLLILGVALFVSDTDVHRGEWEELTEERYAVIVTICVVVCFVTTMSRIWLFRN